MKQVISSTNERSSQSTNERSEPINVEHSFFPLSSLQVCSSDLWLFFSSADPDAVAVKVTKVATKAVVGAVAKEITKKKTKKGDENEQDNGENKEEKS